MILDINKLRFIADFSKTTNPSNLKDFIMTQYCYGGLNHDEVTTLFSMFKLRSA